MNKRLSNGKSLIKAVIKLDTTYVTIELGRTTFVYVAAITEIAEFFSLNLNSIDKQFQLLKNTKYNYDEFCDLCDEGKEDEYKLLSDVFNHCEIKKFAEMIVKKVAASLQVRINNKLY